MTALPTVRLTAAQARRLALGAQGFATPRPTGRVDRRHLRRVLDRVGLVQIDSVNVLARSHELPFYARLGPYPRGIVAEMVDDVELVEYWGHEASYMPVDLHRWFGWRMQRAADGGTWKHVGRIARERPEFVAEVLTAVRDRGPIPASALDDGSGRGGPWWGWKDHKVALEYLFWTGAITARRRGASFERHYDLTERVLARRAVVAPAPDPAAWPDEREAYRHLLARAVRHLGVATARDAADYHRLNVPTARPVLDALVADGSVRAAVVDGWRDPAYLDPDAVIPRRVEATALLSPFDSLVWARDRTERLFGFRYRLEFYTPAPKRIYGYYVMPFLRGDTIVARVDVKADRATSVLRVHGAFAEPGHATDATAAALAAELTTLAGWLALGDVALEPGALGDLAGLLAAALARA